MTPEQRLSRINEILAAGVLRLIAAKQHDANNQHVTESCHGCRQNSGTKKSKLNSKLNKKGEPNAE